MTLILGRLATGLMRVVGPVQRRPPTPNTTHAPLGQAPTDRVDLYPFGTTRHSLVYQDDQGVQPRSNPSVPTHDGLFAAYVVPERIDAQIAGPSRYTLPDILVLDPRILAMVGDLSSIQQALPTTFFQESLDALTAATQVGRAYPLGGSVSQGLQNATPAPAINTTPIRLTGSDLTGYTITLVSSLRTENAGTSVAASLYDITNPATPVLIGSTPPSVSLTGEVLTADLLLNAGTRTYQLWLTPSNGAAVVYGNAYLRASVTS